MGLAARTWHRSAHPRDVPRCSASGTRIVVPGAPSIGKAEASFLLMGRYRERQACQVLPVDGVRPEAADRGNVEVGAPRPRDRKNHEARLKHAMKKLLHRFLQSGVRRESELDEEIAT